MVENWYDYDMQESVFAVRCHGEYEETRIPHSWFQFGPVNILSAEAFKTEKNNNPELSIGQTLPSSALDE